MPTEQDQEVRINAALVALATAAKANKDNIGDLGSLQGAQTGSMVAAVNEALTAANSNNGSLLATNNLSDVANPGTARSNLDVQSVAEVAQAIATAVGAVTAGTIGAATQADIDAAKAELIGTAPETLNTFQELVAAMDADDSAFAALQTVVSNKVGFVAQTLTQPQKVQARVNIGIGSPVDFEANVNAILTA